jgi:hypothetical protein
MADVKKLRAQSGKELPYSSDNWEVRDVYVIEIKSKDPRYPQSKKQIYIDKECLAILYAIAWDRAGVVWKVWSYGYIERPLADGDKTHIFSVNYGIDVQFGLATSSFADFKVNGNGFTYSDFTPSALLKIGR